MSSKHWQELAGLIFSVVLVLAGAVALLWLLGWWPQAALAQGPVGTAFTYQGQLKQGSTPVNGPCDFQFGLWDAASGGNPVGITQTHSISVTNGLFTVNDLDFGGDAFSGDARWLQIEARCPAGSGSYTLLDPRQELTPAPYALYARSTGALQGWPISTTAPTADQVLTWDGGTWAPANVKGSPYANVIVVAKSGGDYTSIQAALDSISDNSDSNRYLVWVAPGTYTETVTMKPYVDIEGAGELVTKITYTGSTSGYTGTVIGANDAELRFLTVENTGGSGQATAIHDSSTSPRLTHVTATASGGSTNTCGVRNRSSSPTMTHVTASGSGGSSHNCGVSNSDSSSPTMTDVTATGSGGNFCYGVSNDDSSPTMTDVTATAWGGNDSYGVHNNDSSPTMTDVTATASGGSYNYGVFNYESSPTIRNSVISSSHGIWVGGLVGGGGTYTVTINNSQIMGSVRTIHAFGGATLVGASLLDGGAVWPDGGTITCAGVYDENYTFYPSTCP